MSDDIFDLVKAGDVAAVTARIASDPEIPRARNAQGLSPIQTAFFMGRHAIVDALLAAEPELDAFEAAIVGDEEQLAARLAARLRSDDGKSAADYARAGGHEELARRLEAG